MIDILDKEIFDKLDRTLTELNIIIEKYSDVFGDILNGMMPITKEDVKIIVNNSDLVYIEDKSILEFTQKHIYIDCLNMLKGIKRIYYLLCLLAEIYENKLLEYINDDIKADCIRLLQLNKEIIYRTRNCIVFYAPVKTKVIVGKRSYAVTGITVKLDYIILHRKNSTIRLDWLNADRYEFVDYTVRTVIQKVINMRINEKEILNQTINKLRNTAGLYILAYKLGDSNE